MKRITKKTTTIRIGLKLGLVLLLGAGLTQSAQAQFVIGGGVADNFLNAHLPDEEEKLIFEVTSDSNEVRVGRGGDVTTQRSDTDFIVYDPFFSTDSTEEALFFNASTSNLTIGSGDSVNGGDDGDIALQNGSGATAISMNGSNASVTIGNTDNAGDIFVRNISSETSFQVEGSTGNVTNILTGEGLVKAWCRVNADGSFDAGFRCNSSSAETRRVTDPGTYEVDFTALGTDISERPHIVSCSNNGFGSACEEITSVQRGGDSSSLFIQTKNSDGSQVNSPFTVVIF